MGVLTWLLLPKLEYLPTGNRNLVIAISSRALFNLDESHRVYQEQGLEAYSSYQVEREDEPLYLRLPRAGHFKVSDRPGENVIDLEIPVFKGPVVKTLRLDVQAVEEDLIVDDYFAKYSRIFAGDPASWVGDYGPEDAEQDCPEALDDWRLWYRIDVLADSP